MICKKLIIKLISIVIFLYIFYFIYFNRIIIKERNRSIREKENEEISRINNYNRLNLEIKNITIDILIPFAENQVDKVLESIERWGHPNKLPCDNIYVQDYFRFSKSNLVFYQNFGINKNNENKILEKVKNQLWRKCFNKILFKYANNTIEEDKYPKGVSKMFYKYFKIVDKSTDYFFWFESDVNPIKKNWLIEIFRVVVTTLQARRNQPFYVMGSNHRIPGTRDDQRAFHSMHINGNAIYYSKEWYKNLLFKIENWDKGFGVFDLDIFYYLTESENWGEVAKILQEFIHYEIIQNLGHREYNAEEFSKENPRTYLVHS
ncbi:hypothetical protein DICPUDRAFT_81009 [Dictyostelium purpureum]|uniref:Uncharacterized protein n=1 Tax=Dictyostelium purpureum TaxID=5786 RepID=F0ZS78_DICPU|nr:uncharacterized protein DICPUDRAFT_81009 [Dictyostelium purpureum]EGC33199.1 hypothetical protein DICPUDRAFT_81009 [Dictyostelium purpureum]|eukprot:XP_003290281.1 hypothetical protein DICPUDRAFT_81009 [Dictyostelium purpureum]